MLGFIRKWNIYISIVFAGIGVLVLIIFGEPFSTVILFIISAIPQIVDKIINKQEAKREEELNETENFYRKIISKKVEESDELKDKIEEIKYSKIETKKTLDKVRNVLIKEGINKEELVKNITDPLRSIVFLKRAEDIPNKRFLLRDKILPSMGAIHIRGGLYIVPPKRINQNLRDRELLKWFKNYIDNKLPNDYEYAFIFIGIVDIKKTDFINNLPEFRKDSFSYLDKVPVEDLFSEAKILNFLKNKKHIAIKDIIESPSLPFLVEDFITSKSNISKLNKNNSQIIEDIIDECNLDELKTTDLSQVDAGTLSTVLDNYEISEPEKIADNILKNSRFWKLYLEGKNLTEN